MQYKEYGSTNAKTILFLHGGGLSWWNYREEAKMLKNEYHIIVPILDGHAGSDKPFSTIESNARDIISFIREYLNGSVFMLCGLSLGGQIALEMLSQQGDICQHAIIESAAVISSGITNALISPAFRLSYPLVKQRWFAKMQFRQLRLKAEHCRYPDLFRRKGKTYHQTIRCIDQRCCPCRFCDGADRHVSRRFFDQPSACLCKYNQSHC